MTDIDVLVVDRATNNVIDRIEDATSLRYTTALSAEGTTTFKVPLSSRWASRSMLGIGRRELLIIEDGEAVWGGPITARNATTDDSGKWMNVTASTPDWYFGHAYLDEDMTLSNVDIFDIVRHTIDFCLSKPGAAVPGLIVDQSASGSRAGSWKAVGSARKALLQELGDLAQRQDRGFEWRWTWSWDRNTGQRTARLDLGMTHVGTTQTNYPIIFGHPAITSVSETEDVEGHATVVHLLGGQDALTGKQIAVTEVNDALIAAGVGRIEMTVSRPDLTSTPDARAVALQILARVAPPDDALTVTLRPGAMYPLRFGTVGDRLVFRDFPHGLQPAGEQRIETRNVAVSDDGDLVLSLETRANTDVAGGASGRYSAGQADAGTSGALGRVTQGGITNNQTTVFERNVRADTTYAYWLGVAADESGLPLSPLIGIESSGRFEVVFDQPFPASLTNSVYVVANAYYTRMKNGERVMGRPLTVYGTVGHPTRFEFNVADTLTLSDDRYGTLAVIDHKAESFDPMHDHVVVNYVATLVPRYQPPPPDL